MTRQTRGWAATLRPGPVPKLIVRGEVCTHPYAQAFLKESRSSKEDAHTLDLTLTVLADTPRADLKEWTGVSFERNLIGCAYERVRIAGTGTLIEIDVRAPAGARR